MFVTRVNSGYCQVALCKNHKAYRRYVHQLVAQAFVDNPQGHSEVHHKDYDKQNNSADNLEWISHLDNIIDLRNRIGSFKDSHNRLKTHRCQECGITVLYKSKWCKKCANSHIKRHYKHRKLSKEEVNNVLIQNNGNFTKAAEQFDITDNALRKWCIKYNLPSKSRDWKQFLAG